MKTKRKSVRKPFLIAGIVVGAAAVTGAVCSIVRKAKRNRAM